MKIANGRLHVLSTTSSSPGWYQVYTQAQTTPPAYTYNVPSSTERVYVYPVPTLAAGIGQVKIKVPSHDTSIFVDGQFAGTTNHVAKLGLEAGTHSDAGSSRKYRV